MRLIFRVLFVILLAFSFLRSPADILAQDEQPDEPVYIVQEGDSLWDIAYRFRVSVDDLSRANGITDPNQLVAGAKLVIPGLSGIQGVLDTVVVPFGESLKSLSRRYQVPIETIIRLNHLTSPAELYVGSTLAILKQDDKTNSTRRHYIVPGESLLELAVTQGVSPWSFVQENNLINTSNATPGDVLHISNQVASDEPSNEPGALPEAINKVDILPQLLIQGKAMLVQVGAEPGMHLAGKLTDRGMIFFTQDNSNYLSLQGVHAMTEPGLYSLVISGTLPSGAPFSYSQGVLISAGNYPFDPVLTVSPETIDPAVTRPEDAEWAALTVPVTPEKLWEGMFTSPAPPPYNDCWPSRFGNRRSYNGSAYQYFHTGLDFCGGVGTEILAPAAGRIVFAGPLTVRGNATVIDHGWGIYTGYLHQSEILVKPGDLVQQGQIIGKVGGTGRVTGPHLHWEIWANGVQVDPMDWLEQAYPPEESDY